MYRTQRIELLSILLWFGACISLASRTYGNMCQLTSADGLHGNSIGKVIRASDGRVWTAAGYGINVFDGHSIDSYDISVCGHPHNTCVDICEDANGTIYAATRDGIIALSRGSDRFRHILPEIEKPLCVFADSSVLYVGGTYGLYCYKGKRLTNISFNQGNIGMEKDVRHIRKAKNGSIYFLTRSHLHCYDTTAGNVSTTTIAGNKPENVSFGQLALIGNTIYIGTKNDGLYRLEKNSHSLKQIEGIGNVITSMESQGEHLYIGTDGSGAYVVDSRRDSIVEHFGALEANGHHIPTNAVYYYIKDQYGTDWIGMARHGLAYIRRSSELFKPFVQDGYMASGFGVRSFHIGAQDCLIGMFDGFTYINRKSDETVYFSPDELDGAHIITAIEKFGDMFYIGTYDGGLKLFNPKDRQMVKQTFSPSLDNANVICLTQADSSIWIGTSDGLFVIDSQGRCRHFTEKNSRITGGTISSITPDKHGNMWVTSITGFSLCTPSFSFETGNFPKRFIDHEKHLKGTTGHDDALLFHNDFSAYRADASTLECEQLDVPAFILDKRCCELLDDGMGHYWFATDNGLMRTTYDMEHVSQFGQADGLEGHIVNKMETDGSGMLWVATNNGLFHMSPNDMKKWEEATIHKSRLCHLVIGGNTLSTTACALANVEKRFSLDWNLWSEKLTFATILDDFAQKSGRLFEYTIDGNKWQIVKEAEEASLSSLSLGQHKLCIRMAGVPGSQTDFLIHVYPSWLFSLEVIVGIALAVFVLFWLRYRRDTKALLSERDEMEVTIMEMVEEQQNQEEGLEEMKGPKYQKARLDEADCKDIATRMTQLMESKKLYLNPELKRADIATELGVSPSKLSQVISLYMKDNYYDFVNRFRMEEFKRMIANEEYRRYTLTALSEQCGFKKTSFFTTFRKVEGMTPTEYLKSHNISMKY